MKMNKHFDPERVRYKAASKNFLMPAYFITAVILFAITVSAALWTAALLIALQTFCASIYLYFQKARMKSHGNMNEQAEKLIKEYFYSLLGISRLPHQGLTENLTEFCNELQKRYDISLLKKDADLGALQRQINPHFLYNTLDSIRGKALMHNANEIVDMTEALSSIFRYNISQKAVIVPLRDEIWNVETYFKIQQYRFNKRFNLKIRSETQALDCYLPRMTLQPIVENCIFHGLEVKDEPGMINIHCTLTEKRLILTVSDDGVGIPRNTLDKIKTRLKDIYYEETSFNQRHSGIALNNINKRIKLMYGEEYGLSISSQVGVGTEVEIALPIIDKYIEDKAL